MIPTFIGRGNKVYKCSEKLTMAEDASGNGYWVISQFTDNFMLFKVSTTE
jgi:hypothetical protein